MFVDWGVDGFMVVLVTVGCDVVLIGVRTVSWYC